MKTAPGNPIQIRDCGPAHKKGPKFNDRIKGRARGQGVKIKSAQKQLNYERGIDHGYECKS